MNRALVIYGDKRIGGAIADGLTAKELEMVRAENKRLNAVNGVRSYADEKRLRAACEELAAKYPTEEHGRLYGAVLGAWGLFCLAITEWVKYLQAWNREGA